MIRGDDRLAALVGGRVKTLRLSRGMTQKALAELVGSYRPIICRIESGTHVPTVQTLARIAHAFGLDLSSFFTGLDTTPTEAVMRLRRFA